MKAKALITLLLTLWLASPNRAAETNKVQVLAAACKACGGDVAYVEGDKEGTCQTCGRKMVLVLFMIGGCLLVCVGGCYVAQKLKKLNGTNGAFNVTNRFGTNLLSALTSTNSFSIVRSDDPADVPYLLSLATAPSSTGRYVMECSTNAVDWLELGRYQSEDFLAIHEAPHAAALYRVRVE